MISSAHRPLSSRCISTRTFSPLLSRLLLALALAAGLSISAQAQLYELGRTAAAEAPAAGADSVVLAVSSSTGPWAVTSDAAWLQPASGSVSGSGSANVIFQFEANTGPTRTATLTLGGQTLTVTQASSTFVTVAPFTPLLSSGLHGPTFLALDGAGNIYFADEFNNAIKELSPATGTVSALVSSGIFEPQGVAVDAAGNVYFADGGNNAIKEWSAATRQVSTLVSSGLDAPHGVAVDAAGNVYIADSGNQALKEWSAATGQVSTLVSSGLTSPYGVAVDRAGNVYIADAGSYQIKELSAAAGTLSTLVSSGLLQPEGVAVDGAGNVYIADSQGSAIKELNAATGTVSTLVTPGLEFPIGVAVDSADDVYAADNLNNVIEALPRALIDPSAKQEQSAAGSDSIALLPASENLQGILAPTSNADWLTVDSASGGSVSFSFTENLGPARTAQVTVLGQTISVTQYAPYALGASTALEAPAAGADSIRLVTNPVGAWTATSNASWIQIAQGSASGTGSATVVFNFEANPGATRTGTLTIGGLTFTVTQAGASFVKASPFLTLVSSGLYAPSGMAVDGAGNVYFADTGNNAIKELNAATGTVSTLVSSGLYHPYGVAVDGAGNVYIADTGNNAIKELSAATGEVSTLVSSGLNNPYGVAVDGAGNVYIADTNDGAIKELSAGASTVSTLVSSGLDYPSGIAVDSVGNVYIADTGNNAIKELSAATGQVLTLVASGLDAPNGVAVDGAGNVYIADTGASAIKELSAATGAVSTLVSTGLNAPAGVAVDAAGNIYIGDTQNYAIEKVSPAFVDASSRTESSAGGADLVNVLPVSQSLSGALAPTSDRPWLTVGASGNGVVSFSLAPNLGAVRTGHLTVLGQTITVAQQAAPFYLGAASAVQGPGASSSSILLGVASPPGPWTAASNASWIQVEDGSTLGNISSHVNYSVAANTGPTRSGTITVAGQTFTVTQAGAGFVPASPIALVSSALNFPWGVAVDTAGNVYIADSGNNAIKEWNASTQQISTLVSSGLSEPAEIAVDSAGDVYIADSGNNAIKEWNASTQQISTLVSSGLNSPSGVAVDSAGNVYIADGGNTAIKEWNASTQQISTLASTNPYGPSGLAVDGLGIVYIVYINGQNAPSFVALSPGNPEITPILYDLDSPYGVAVDQFGNVYIADSGNNAIDQFSFSTNKNVTRFSTGLDFPLGVAVDSTGNLYIADTKNNAIKELPNLFLSSVSFNESFSAGSDSVTILPASANLQGTFAPASDSSWLTPGTISDGVISFSFTQNVSLSPRSGHITAAGQTITVTQGPTAPPVAVDDVAYADSTASITIDALTNDAAQAGLTLKLASVTQPAFGRVVINSGGTTLTYSPAASLASTSHEDVFFYTITQTDGTNDYGTATATVTVRNPYYPVKGTYNGLAAYSGGDLDGQPAGYLSLALSGGGSFTGTLKLGDASYAFLGAFNLLGQATVAIQPPGRPAPTPIVLSLGFDETNASGVTGTFTIGSQSYAVSTGAREIYNSAADPDPSAGYYTVQLPAPPAPVGTTATAAAAVSNGKIVAIDVSTGGGGYFVAPRVTITGAPGKGAVAAAAISGGAVTAITVTAPGSHYPSTGVVITIDPPSAALPAGTGWATMTVTESGAVTLAGLLGDGTHFSAGASISTAVGVDSFAFYLPLYVTTKLAPPGSIGGTFAFEPETDSDCDGMLYWIKPAQPTAALYPSGFSTSVSFAAASYAAPTTGLPLQFSSATAPTAQIVFSGGDLTAPITDALSFSSKGAITETGATADKLKLTLNHKTGLLTGSLLPVPKSPSATISGVIYQKTNAGVGLFLGPSQSSRFTLSPQ